MTKGGRQSNLSLHFSRIFPTTVSVLALMTSSLLDEASKVIPEQPILINVVSRRVRQLSQGHRPLVEVGPRMGYSDIALKEIIEGKITYELTSEHSEAA